MELKIEHVSKQFQKHYAIKDVSLTLEKGIVGVLGANGSGKTTLLRMLVGNLKPDEGHITYGGKEINTIYQNYASLLGYMPQHVGFYTTYTIQEFLSYMGLLKGLDRAYLQSQIHDLLEQLSLSDKANCKIKTLSGGMLQRVGIAQALLNDPDILILDEPTAGLDPKERIVLRNILTHRAKNTLVILSTHIVSDIESIADEVIVMKQGELIFHEPIPGLLSQVEGNVYEVLCDRALAEHLEQVYTIIKYEDGIGTQRKLRLLSEKPPCEGAVPVSPNLDDFYLYHFDGRSSNEPL